MSDAIVNLGLGGAPPLYSDPAEMAKEIDAYFEHVKGEFSMVDKFDKKGFPVQVKVWSREPEPITITGLCLYLGFESRQSFYDYEKRPGFSYIIKRARLRIENNYEKKLHSEYVPGPMFALKNMGWSDKCEITNVNKEEKEIDYSKLDNETLDRIVAAVRPVAGAGGVV